MIILVQRMWYVYLDRIVAFIINYKNLLNIEEVLWEYGC